MNPAATMAQPAQFINLFIVFILIGFFVYVAINFPAIVQLF